MRKIAILCVAGIILLTVLLCINEASARTKRTYGATAIEYAVTEQIVNTVSNYGYTVEELTAPVDFWMDYGPFEITAYCSCEVCCGVWSQYQGLTASGKPIQEGKTISVDPNVIPLGTEVKIVFADGTEHIYEAQDTGSAIKGNIIDLYFADHSRACQFGRQTCRVYIKELNDGRN